MKNINRKIYKLKISARTFHILNTTCCKHPHELYHLVYKTRDILNATIFTSLPIKISNENLSIDHWSWSDFIIVVH